MARNTARKTVGRPFKKGVDPRRGVGKKGRSGRKPSAFKQFAGETLTDPDVQQRLLELARAGDMSVINTLARYSQELPAGTHKLGGDDEPVVFTLKLGDDT